MSETLVQAIIGDVGDNACYFKEQDRYRDYILKTVWKIETGITIGVITSEVEPSVEDRDKLWFKLGVDGGLDVPVPLVYSATYARWVGRHPQQRGSGFAHMIWTGTTDQLKTFDGGSDAAVTPTTGPMWEVNAAFEDLFPVGVKAGGLIEAPLTSLEIFDDATPGPPSGVGVYFIRRTERIFYIV